MIYVKKKRKKKKKIHKIKFKKIKKYKNINYYHQADFKDTAKWRKTRGVQKEKQRGTQKEARCNEKRTREKKTCNAAVQTKVKKERPRQRNNISRRFQVKVLQHVKRKDKVRKRKQSIDKKQEVMRVQKGGLKVKLKEVKGPNNTASTSTDKEHKSFPSRMGEYRAVKRIEKELPKTPRKQARVIQRLLESPRSRQILEQKGTVATQDQRKFLATETCGVLGQQT